MWRLYSFVVKHSIRDRVLGQKITTELQSGRTNTQWHDTGLNTNSSQRHNGSERSAAAARLSRAVGLERYKTKRQKKTLNR